MAFKITTRITNRGGDCGRLKITVENYWKFWNCFLVKDNREVREYLKSSDFQEFIYQLFSKYEDMDFEEMSDLWEIDNEKDNEKIKEKLDRYLWIAPTNTSENDVYIRITKRECMDGSGFGMYCGDWFIQGRIYNKDLSRYKSFHYYTHIEPNDVVELAIDEEMSDEEIEKIRKKYKNNLTYRKELIYKYIDFDFERFAHLIKSFDDCTECFEALNETIKGYNERYRICA